MNLFLCNIFIFALFFQLFLFNFDKHFVKTINSLILVNEWIISVIYHFFIDFRNFFFIFIFYGFFLF